MDLRVCQVFGPALSLLEAFEAHWDQRDAPLMPRHSQCPLSWCSLGQYGIIETDTDNRTHLPTVFAIGDVAGGKLASHASQQGRNVARLLFEPVHEVHPPPLPSVHCIPWGPHKGLWRWIRSGPICSIRTDWTLHRSQQPVCPRALVHRVFSPVTLHCQGVTTSGTHEAVPRSFSCAQASIVLFGRCFHVWGSGYWGYGCSGYELV